MENDIYGNDESYCSRGGNFELFPGFEDSDLEFPGCRTIMQSQTNLLDEIVGQIVDRLKANHLWENTLFIFQSDNVC